MLEVFEFGGVPLLSCLLPLRALYLADNLAHLCSACTHLKINISKITIKIFTNFLLEYVSAKYHTPCVRLMSVNKSLFD